MPPRSTGPNRPGGYTELLKAAYPAIKMPFFTGGWHPDSPINQLADIRDLMVANGDSGKLIWSSEYGEPTAVASEAQQAAFLQDMLTTWRTLDYTGPAFVYTLQDTDSGSTDPEARFGLIRSDGTWKPAAYIVRDLATSPATTPVGAAMAVVAAAVPQSSPAATPTAGTRSSDTRRSGPRTRRRRSGRSGAGQAGQTTRLPRRARDRMSHR
jgi:hypothetical protein